MLKKIALLTLLLSFSGLFAAPKTPKHAVIENEDLQFIFDWQKDQKLKTLAESLALSQEQADQLRAIRGEVDQIKASYEPTHTALKAELEAKAREIREKLEAGGTFGDQDRDSLEDIHRRARKVKREERLKLALAAVDLADVLTTEQKRILYRTPLRHDGAGAMEKFDGTEVEEGDGEAPEATRPLKGRANHRRHGRFGKGEGFARKRDGRHGFRQVRMARILLSDGFLKNLG